jgi:hypothetical protein
LTVCERLGRRQSALPSALAARMGHLSPWSPAEALPPTAWPIKRWTVDSG